jgi:hypothetical protein
MFSALGGGIGSLRHVNFGIGTVMGVERGRMDAEVW